MNERSIEDVSLTLKVDQADDLATRILDMKKEEESYLSERSVFKGFTYKVPRTILEKNQRRKRRSLYRSGNVPATGGVALKGVVLLVETNLANQFALVRVEGGEQCIQSCRHKEYH